jgi:hypothetical protein
MGREMTTDGYSQRPANPDGLVNPCDVRPCEMTRSWTVDPDCPCDRCLASRLYSTRGEGVSQAHPENTAPPTPETTLAVEAMLRATYDALTEQARSENTASLP